jgi:hypothetical protein|uniref:Uncharacterized protein n=1 Tax=Castor canadensis TaxID=51338 RepID=A0A8C0VZW1_CASCN
MKAFPHSLHSWSFFSVGVFLWVTTICLKIFCLSTLAVFCCCSKVPSTSEVALNVEMSMLSFSENTGDSTSVIGGCGSDPLPLVSGPSSATSDGKFKDTCSGYMEK